MTRSENDLSPTVRRWIGGAATLLIAVAAMASAMVLFRAVGQWNAYLSTSDLVIFYALPSVTTVAFVLTLVRTSVGFRVNVALMLISAGLGLAGVDTVLFTVSRPTESHPMETPDGEPVPSSEQVMRDLRTHGVRAYSRVTEGPLIESDVSFATAAGRVHPISPAPGFSTVVLCSEASEPVVYQADRYGFNNPDPAWDKDVDLALVGDSYVHGMCVPHKEQLAAVLDSGMRTLNLGATNSGPLRELAILREYVTPKTPPIVAWVYYEGNDLADLALEDGHRWLFEYLDAGHRQGLPEHQKILDQQYAHWLDALIDGTPVVPNALPNGVISGGYMLHDLIRLSSLRGALHFGEVFPSKTPLGVLPQVLLRANADVAGWGGRFIVVYMPEYLRYERGGGKSKHGRAELIRFLARQNIPLVDLDPIFRATGHPKLLWAHPRGHLNAEGYKLSARAIAATIDGLNPAPFEH